jgi:hypothetical protein
MADRTVISAVIVVLVAVLLAELFPGKPPPRSAAAAASPDTVCFGRRWTGDPRRPFESAAWPCEAEASSR